MAIIEVVFNTLKEMEDSFITLKQLSELLPEYKAAQIKLALRELTLRGKIKRGSEGWSYTTKPIVEKVSNYALVPIREEEVKAARRDTYIGMKMVAMNNRKLFKDSDDEPDTIIVTITSKHPHLCMTDKGISFTWAEVAKYLRDKRTPIGA